MENKTINYLINFITNTTGAKQAITSIDGLRKTVRSGTDEMQTDFGNVDKILKTTSRTIGSAASTQITQFSHVIKNTSGEFKNLTYQAEMVDGKMKVFKDTIKGNSLATKDFNKSTMSFADNFKKLAARAALTIPIWLALRTVVMGVFRTIGEGLKYWTEIDKEMQRVSMTMGDVGNKQEVMNEVFKQANEISKETGQSMNKIVKSFYQFKTLGLSVTDSMAGMNAVTKGSIALMADLEGLSEALSQSYKILGNTMDQTLKPQDLLESNLGKILLLFRDNAFVTDEMAAAVNRFLPTAKTMNFTFDETIALMATLHSAAIKNTRAGRLMRTSVAQLQNNLGKIGDLLGIRVNPNLERTPEMLNKVLVQLKKLEQVDKTKFEEAMDIFGGVRGQETARALLAIFETYQENLEKVNMSSARAIKIFNEQYKEGLGYLNVQLDRMKLLRKEWGRVFVTAALGADDFVGAIKQLNKFLDHSTFAAKALGDALYNYVVPALAAISGAKLMMLLGAASGFSGMMVGAAAGIIYKIKTDKFTKQARADIDSAKFVNDQVSEMNKALKGNMSHEELAVLWADLLNPDYQKILMDRGESKSAILAKADFVYQQIMRLIKGKGLVELPGVTIEGEAGGIQTLSPEIEKKIRLMKDELKYIQMSISGYTKRDIIEQKLYSQAQSFVDMYNTVNEKGKEDVANLTAQQAIMAVMSGDYQKIYDLTVDRTKGSEMILAIEKEILEVGKSYMEVVEEFSKAIQENFQNAFRSLIENKSTIDDFFNTIGTSLREQITGAFSEAFTTEFFKKTGMGEMFGGIFTNITDIFTGDRSLAGAMYKASKKGSDLYYDKIIKASLIGANAMAEANGTTVTGLGMEADAAIAGFGGLSKYLGFMDKPMWQTPNYKTVPGPGGGTIRGIESYTSGPSWGAGVGAGIGVGTSAYSAYQTGGALGAGMAGVGTGILAAKSMGILGFGATGAIGGAAAGTAMAALGTILPVLGVALAIGSMFIKKTPPKWSQEDTKESTKQVASRIDITNQELAWVNRNLVAMRNELTYIMQRSYYFREQGTNELFSIDSRRGVS